MKKSYMEPKLKKNQFLHGAKIKKIKSYTEPNKSYMGTEIKKSYVEMMMSGA